MSNQEFVSFSDYSSQLAVRADAHTPGILKPVRDQKQFLVPFPQSMVAVRENKRGAFQEKISIIILSINIYIYLLGLLWRHWCSLSAEPPTATFPGQFSTNVRRKQQKIVRVLLPPNAHERQLAHPALGLSGLGHFNYLGNKVNGRFVSACQAIF